MRGGIVQIDVRDPGATLDVKDNINLGFDRWSISNYFLPLAVNC